MDAPKLTLEQEIAVSHNGPPACVIAGAGTGKTQTLCERIVWLVKKKRLNPERIAVTTFTRKATAELFQRAREQLGDDATKLKISTIDALISDLAGEAAQKGWLHPFQLIGEAEQRVLLRECAWEVWSNGQFFSRKNLHWVNFNESPEAEELFKDAQGLQGLLEAAFRLYLTDNSRERRGLEEQLREAFLHATRSWWDGTDVLLSKSRCDSWDNAQKRLKACVERYHQKIKELGFLDYDGLRQRFINLLRKERDVRREFASRFDAILVDEFQDTSRSQTEFLRLLAGRNIWFVGDPCQQIYEWRGANPDPLIFIRESKSKRYFLTKNFRSTQPILDFAFRFLSKRLPRLRKNGLLKHLEAANRDGMEVHPIYRGTTDQALQFVSALLFDQNAISPSDVAILSRDLTHTTIKSLERSAQKYGLQLQFHSTSAERTLEETISGTGSNGSVPRWKPGEVLNKLYRHREIADLLRRLLRKGDFDEMRKIRPLAMAADAVDRASSLRFDEAWPALKKTQDREVAVSAAVASKKTAIQVMTIHAAKGLEFPIVLLMKWGRKFPRDGSAEDARLAYVGMTRAKQLLVLVHTQDRLRETFKRLGGELPLVPHLRREPYASIVKTEKNHPVPPPVVAATHLDLYTQCPLKFAAYHEGRFLPQWSKSQSMGSRMHKALELFLSAWPWANNKEVQQYLQEGLQHGDSPLRKLPRPFAEQIGQGFKMIASDITKTCKKVLDVECRYHYVGNGGQVEGAIDALIETRQGAVVLKEWKTSSEIPLEKIRQYTLQASAGLLGVKYGKSVDLVELIPVLAPNKLVRLQAKELRENSPDQLENVFKAIQDRKYDPQKGPHCKECPLKRHCPAWTRRGP